MPNYAFEKWALYCVKVKLKEGNFNIHVSSDFHFVLILYKVVNIFLFFNIMCCPKNPMENGLCPVFLSFNLS